jgi:TetR/AcrR family transcriptional repressor of mexJK operon
VVTDREPKEDKADLILSAAQRLFGLFGAEKTSMREIADDLHMSKASLYYYFPDKENLYKAVIEKEQAEFLDTLEKDIQGNKDPAESLRRYALNRLSYFKYLVNLGRVGPASIPDFKPLIADSFKAFREKEKKLVMQILEKGEINGQLRTNNTYEAASLFLDIMRGLRSVFLNNNKLVSINDEDYKQLSHQVAAATDIFIKGLMYKELK